MIYAPLQVLLAFSGFLISHVPVFFSWIPKISFVTYSYSAIYQNEFVGLAMDFALPGSGPPKPGAAGTPPLGPPLSPPPFPRGPFPHDHLPLSPPPPLHDPVPKITFRQAGAIIYTGPPIKIHGASHPALLRFEAHSTGSQIPEYEVLTMASYMAPCPSLPCTFHRHQNYWRATQNLHPSMRMQV